MTEPVRESCPACGDRGPHKATGQMDDAVPVRCQACGWQFFADPDPTELLREHEAALLAEIDRQLAAGKLTDDDRWRLRHRLLGVFMDLRTSVRRGRRG